MRLLPFFVTLSIYLFSLVNAATIDRRATTCDAGDIAIVKQQVTSPVYFCTWYLSESRTRSPLPSLTVDNLLKACKCITNSAAKQTLSHKITTTGTLLTCKNANTTPVKNEFKNYSAFCKFYNAITRTTSPIRELDAKGVTHACDCIASTATSSIKTSSSTKKSSTSSKKVSTSTKKISTTSSKKSSSTSSTKKVSTSSTKKSSTSTKKVSTSSTKKVSTSSTKVSSKVSSSTSKTVSTIKSSSTAKSISIVMPISISKSSSSIQSSSIIKPISISSSKSSSASKSSSISKSSSTSKSISISIPSSSTKSSSTVSSGSSSKISSTVASTFTSSIIQTTSSTSSSASSSPTVASGICSSGTSFYLQGRGSGTEADLHFLASGVNIQNPRLNYMQFVSMSTTAATAFCIDDLNRLQTTSGLIAIHEDGQSFSDSWALYFAPKGYLEASEGYVYPTCAITGQFGELLYCASGTSGTTVTRNVVQNENLYWGLDSQLQSGFSDVAVRVVYGESSPVITSSSTSSSYVSSSTQSVEPSSSSSTQSVEPSSSSSTQSVESSSSSVITSSTTPTPTSYCVGTPFYIEGSFQYNGPGYYMTITEDNAYFSSSSLSTATKFCLDNEGRLAMAGAEFYALQLPGSTDSSVFFYSADDMDDYASVHCSMNSFTNGLSCYSNYDRDISEVFQGFGDESWHVAAQLDDEYTQIYLTAVYGYTEPTTPDAVTTTISSSSSLTTSASATSSSTDASSATATPSSFCSTAPFWIQGSGSGTGADTQYLMSAENGASYFDAATTSAATVYCMDSDGSLIMTEGQYYAFQSVAEGEDRVFFLQDQGNAFPLHCLMDSTTLDLSCSSYQRTVSGVGRSSPYQWDVSHVLSSADAAITVKAVFVTSQPSSAPSSSTTESATASSSSSVASSSSSSSSTASASVTSSQSSSTSSTTPSATPTSNCPVGSTFYVLGNDYYEGVSNYIRYDSSDSSAKFSEGTSSTATVFCLDSQNHLVTEGDGLVAVRSSSSPNIYLLSANAAAQSIAAGTEGYITCNIDSENYGALNCVDAAHDSYNEAYYDDLSWGISNTKDSGYISVDVSAVSVS